MKETGITELEDILYVERTAFGYDKEANLVEELMNDHSAEMNFRSSATKRIAPSDISCLQKPSW